VNTVAERRRARLHRAGGSRSLIVPKEWLDRWEIADEVDLVLTDSGIRIEPPAIDAPNLDDDARFASFLQSLLFDAVSNPASLSDVEELLADDRAWLADLGIEWGVEIGRFNGWRILGHPVFRERYLALRSEARRLASTRPVAEARQHPTIKLFAAVNQILTDVIPADPDAPDFRLRDELAMFRRVKGHGLPDRYRLFFVFSSARRVIIVLYLNDDSSLRKEGERTDP
jgi:toxin YhaV